MTVGLVCAALALLILVIDVIITRVKCRCPNCGSFLRDSGYPFDPYTKCPYCGTKLD